MSERPRVEILDYEPPRRWAAAARVGDLLFLAGETGTDPVTLETAPGGAAGQTDQAIRNIAAILARAGATLDDVVKLAVFVTDISLMAEIGAVRWRHFGRALPSSTVQVAALARPDLVVEIEAIAVAPR